MCSSDLQGKQRYAYVVRIVCVGYDTLFVFLGYMAWYSDIVVYVGVVDDDCVESPRVLPNGVDTSFHYVWGFVVALQPADPHLSLSSVCTMILRRRQFIEYIAVSEKVFVRSYAVAGRCYLFIVRIEPTQQLVECTPQTYSFDCRYHLYMPILSIVGGII